MCQGGLQQFHKQQLRPLQVLEDAVSEITEGLEYDLTAAERIRWHHTLAAICTYLVQCHLGINMEASDQEFETATSGLPAINSTLYFELVKRNEWTGHIFMVGFLVFCKFL